MTRDTVAVRRLVVAESPRAGIRLAGTRSIDGSDPFESLLVAFSPVLVAFPDAGPDDLKPPSAGGLADYHPRAVDSFTDWDPHTTIAIPIGGWKAAVLALVPFLLLSLPVATILAFSGIDWALLRALMIIAALLLGVLGWLAKQRTPPTFDQLRQLIQTTPVRDRPRRTRHLAISTMPATTRDPKQVAWDRYRSVIAPRPDRYPRTVYARSVESGGDLYLQYWLFFPFNDWHNWHETDWEVISLRLASRGDGRWRPIGAIYSSHLGGLWRAWDDIERLPGEDGAEHPIAYVAQGSHALYFSAIPEGYPASLNRSIGPARLSMTSDWIDVVATDPGDAAPIDYELKALPRGASSAVDADPWWWLGYFGAWGSHEGVAGPNAQLPKWEAPARWAEDSCVGDPGSWRHLGDTA